MQVIHGVANQMQVDFYNNFLTDNSSNKSELRMTCVL